MSLGYHGEQQKKDRLRLVHIQKKRGASPSLASRCKGLRIALSVETSNAESPTMMYISNMPEHFPTTYGYRKCSKTYVYMHLIGRPRCFVFDRQY